VKLVIDTWGWLALEDSREPFHEAATRIYAKAAETSGNIHTTNFILDETITLLYRRRPFEEVTRFTRGLLTSPFIEIQEITQSRFQRAYDLRLKFRDKPGISFTDITTMVVAQDLNALDILTGDSHFLQVGFGFRLMP
jgi:predicted nucleic acid-binding protein